MERIELYKSIDEMPILRYQSYQIFLLQDSGIGSTMEDVMNHLSKIDHFLSLGLSNEATIERRNLQLNYYSIIESLNYKHLAFACLVKSVDGKEQTEHSQSGIQRTQKLVQEIVTHKEASEQVEKKKDYFNAEIKLYFPKRSTSHKTAEMSFNSALRDQLVNEFYYLSEDVTEAEYKEKSIKFYRQNAPTLLDNTPDSVLFKTESQFDKLLLQVQKEYPQINGSSSVKDFYTACELIEDRTTKKPTRNV